ncbi:hypothetical protein MA20_20010 [Bradyrhizobium japonicum]|uniref:Uncharacterized protein n=1 Tax=Bradyrhizobium japonicum TaxID=375 RepID=A0A0A3XU90_BRAJP|nr:hypothetical protein [Bradyrhizobium japonicum]KGT78007.1 hypothetical protein MA20_20010 [Bradyrhizobium japonicum]
MDDLERQLLLFLANNVSSETFQHGFVSIESTGLTFVALQTAIGAIDAKIGGHGAISRSKN